MHLCKTERGNGETVVVLGQWLPITVGAFCQNQDGLSPDAHRPESPSVIVRENIQWQSVKF